MLIFFYGIAIHGATLTRGQQRTRETVRARRAAAAPRLIFFPIQLFSPSVTVSKTLKRVRRDAVDVLNGKDILYQFPAAFDEGRTVTVLKRPKTKSSIRTVYLPDYGLDVLRDWKGTLTPVKRKQPDLILRYSNGRPLSEETLPRLLEKQLLQLRMPVVSFHSLRHSSISYKLILTGGNIKAVQGDSGHAQAEMITERYGHIIDSCRKQCARDFEEEFYKGM